MDVKTFVTCLLLAVYFTVIQCNLKYGINEKDQKCTFIFSNATFEEFRGAYSTFEACTKQFKNPNLEVEMINCSLPAFPNGTFTTPQYLEEFILKMSNGTQVQLLSPMLPGYLVFENLKFKTAVFDIEDSPSLVGWKWETLSSLQYDQIKSFHFNMYRSHLMYLPSSFGKIANGRLTIIRIVKCRLRWLGKNVFSPFMNLQNLELRDNLIESIERSHLPTEAKELISLDLGNNRLQHLPADFFTDLSLMQILLDGNNIKLIDEHIKHIFDASLSVHGAVFPCVCRDFIKFNKFEHIKHEQCYMDENTMAIKDFNKTCSQK